MLLCDNKHWQLHNARLSASCALPQLGTERCSRGVVWNSTRMSKRPKRRRGKRRHQTWRQRHRNSPLAGLSDRRVMILQDESPTIEKQRCTSCCAGTTYVVCTCLSEYSSPPDTLPPGVMAYSNHAPNTTSVSVKLCAVSGDAHELTVARGARLREVQEQICRLFRKSFPDTKVCLAIGEPQRR